MQTPEYIAARLSTNTLKGRILDIKGAGITVTGDQGKVLARNFTFALTGTRKAQPDPSRAAFNMALLKVVKATNSGGRETWNVTQPMKRLIENTSDVVRDIVGDDANFDENDPYSNLLLIMLAASDPNTVQNAPTYTTTQFVEDGRWYYAGDAEVGKQAVALAANAEIEIVREIKNEQTGETFYRLRVPRADGSGFDFCTVSFADLQMGRNIYFPGRAISIHNSAKLVMCLTGRFDTLTSLDKMNLERTEREQPERDAQARREEQFRNAAPIYSAPHYRQRG